MSMSTSVFAAASLEPKPKSVLAQRFGSYGSNFWAGGSGGAWKRNGVLGPNLKAAVDEAETRNGFEEMSECGPGG
jgi:hypothetical protein